MIILKPSQAAVHAAMNRHTWGAYATRQYIVRHQVPLGLYRLARQLHAVDSIPSLLRRQAT